MPQNSEEVTIGASQLFIAAESIDIPTLTGNAATDFAAFDTPGYTEKGVEVDHTTTDHEVRADEESDPIDVTIDKESNGINVDLLQTNMQNLYYALAGGTMPDASTITFGGKQRPDIFRIGVVGPSTRAGFQRFLVFYRVYAKTALKYSFQRSKESIYKVNFIALADSTQPVGSRTGIYKDFKVV
jgi:hypothetical protein